MEGTPRVWSVEVPEEARTALERSLLAGPIIDDEGRRLLLEARVGMVGGLVVEIFSDEHPPPHFRVWFQGDSANFRIDTGEKLNGGLDRFSRNIRRWHKKHKEDLVAAWNSRRPSDCPVGPLEGE